MKALTKLSSAADDVAVQPRPVPSPAAGQALVLAWLAREHGSLLPGVHRVPAAIDDEIARLALGATGAAIDELSPAQPEYLDSWQQP